MPYATNASRSWRILSVIGLRIDSVGHDRQSAKFTLADVRPPGPRVLAYLGPYTTTLAALDCATPSRGPPPPPGTPMSEANNCVCADMPDEWRRRARRHLDRRLIGHLDVTCRGDQGRDALRTSSPPFAPAILHVLRRAGAMRRGAAAGSRRFAHCSQCSPLGVVRAGEGLRVRRSGAVRQSIDVDELRRRTTARRRAFTPSASRVSNGASSPQVNAAGRHVLVGRPRIRRCPLRYDERSSLRARIRRRQDDHLPPTATSRLRFERPPMREGLAA